MYETKGKNNVFTKSAQNFWVLFFFLRQFPETDRFPVKNYGVSFYRIQVQ